MKPEKVKEQRQVPGDRIEDEKIILDGRGEFPKRVIILEPGKTREYKLIKTRNGGFLLN